MKYDLSLRLNKTYSKLLSSLTEDFLDYLICMKEIKSITKKRREVCRLVCEVFLCNAINSVRNGNESLPITLHKDDYSSSIIVNGRDSGVKVSYKFTKLLTDYLESEGSEVILGGREYCNKKGKWNKHRHLALVSSKITTIRLHKEFLALITKQDKPFNLVTNLLILRDEEKKSKSYRMNEDLKSKLAKLKSYNKLSLKTETTLKIEGKTVKLDTRLRRIYNMSFFKGGRHYCYEVQSLSKEERKKMLMDGKPTVMLDYSAFEPSIAYSLNNKLMLGDPYKMPMEGFCPEIARTLNKNILLRIFNCSDRKSLFYSVNKFVREDSGWDLNKLYEEGKIPDNKLDINDLIDKLEEKHKGIANFFYNPDGNEEAPDLARVGASIMEYTLEYFLQHHGVLALPVFDEVIVPEEYQEEAVSCMYMAFEKITGFKGNCFVTKEN